MSNGMFAKIATTCSPTVISPPAHLRRLPSATIWKRDGVPRPLVAAVARHIGARNCDAAWLDVGFGGGALLLTAAEFGSETVGLESDPAHVAALRQLGFEGHLDTIESFEAPGRFAA